MRFLLTNDDGIDAQGLAAIKQELEKVGEVMGRDFEEDEDWEDEV